MNEIQNIETKVENGGATPQGRVSAAEFNILVDAAKRFDVSKYGAARITADNLLQFFADADSMASYEANPQTNAALLLKSLALPMSTVDISGKLDKAEFYRYFEEVNIGTEEAPVYATRSKRGLFSDSFLSAMGLNPGTGGGGGGGATALYELNDVQLSGLLTGDLLIYDGTHWVNRPQSSIVPNLSEYATRTWVQQQGYATSAALAAHAGDTTLHVTSSERTLWNRTAADFAAIVGADSDQIINKWEEVVAFLDTYTEADTLANLLSNKVDKVAGYGLSKNDFTDALLSKLNGIDEGANRYTHPTGGADASIGDAAGRVLSGITVNALGHVTSISSKTLAAADIPTLAISKVSGLQDALDSKLDKAVFDSMFELVNEGTTSAPKYAIRAKYGLYADGFLSALGLNSSGGGGEGGGSYDRLDAWSDYTSERAGWVLSAGLGYDLHSRVRSLEGGSALSFTTEGSGNVVTAVKKSGTAVVVTKGLTALTSHQPIYALNFQAGAFEAKKYTPNTGAQTVNIPTKTSHLSNDSGFITSAALTGYATQSWVQGLGYITASALTPYITSATANATFATKLGVSGNQIGTYVNGKLGNLITVPYASNADTVDALHSSDFFRQYSLGGGSNKTFDFNTIIDGGYNFCSRDILNATLINSPVNSSDGGFGLFVLRYSSYRSQIFFHYLTNAIFTRCRYLGSSDYAWTEWKRLAYTDSNVASATNANNSDMLDGLHKSDFGQTFYNIALDANDYENLPYLYAGKLYNATNVPYTYYPFLHFGGGRFYAQFSAYGNALKFRASRESDYTPEWRTVAFTDSNVASATKLETARTLWGQLFDGTGNIVNPAKMQFIKFSAIDGSDAGYIGRPLSSVDDIYISSYTNKNIILFTKGNVGVGVESTSPAYKLDVTGAIHATTGIFSDGYMSAKGINTASDVRLKRRIADVALTVRDVAEAPVYRFAWINGGGIDVGSTAQYWAARVPELTHLLADGTHLGLDYGKAALLSVVAVARSTANHERRIAALERQLQNRTI